MASAPRDEQDYCESIETMFGQKIPLNPHVKYVIDKGIEESTLMDPEKKALVIESTGYLCYDIMIVESLRDHEDAKVANGAKQAAENCIKKRLKEMKHSPVEEILYVPLSQEEAIEDIGYAKLFEETKEAAEDYKEMKFDEEKPSATKEPLEILPKETSKQMACESNTSFKGSRVVETRKESDIRKRGPEENEEREDQIYVFERRCSIYY